MIVLRCVAAFTRCILHLSRYTTFVTNFSQQLEICLVKFFYKMFLFKSNNCIFIFFLSTNIINYYDYLFAKWSVSQFFFLSCHFFKDVKIIEKISFYLGCRRCFSRFFLKYTFFLCNYMLTAEKLC